MQSSAQAVFAQQGPKDTPNWSQARTRIETGAILRRRVTNGLIHEGGIGSFAQTLGFVDPKADQAA
jgi:hypothetical protein